MTENSHSPTTELRRSTPFEHLQPVHNRLLAELTDRLHLSRESAPNSYNVLANALVVALLMTHSDQPLPAATTTTTIATANVTGAITHKTKAGEMLVLMAFATINPTAFIAPATAHEAKEIAQDKAAAYPTLTAPLVWLIKRLLTDSTYRAAQLVQLRDKLAKCYYTPPRLFLTLPTWLPASAHLTAQADLDFYPRNRKSGGTKWWERDEEWLTLAEPNLLAALQSSLDHLLNQLAQL